MISILHPSRSRPQKSFKTISKWLSHALHEGHEVIISIDRNDPYKDQYIAFYGSLKNAKLTINDNTCAVQAINKAAREASGDIMIVVSDDTDTIPRWDDIILRAVDNRTDFVLKTYDGVQKWIVTMPIIDRVYYNRFGYVYNPAYQHMFSDTEFTHVADALRKIIWRNDIVIPHLHYSVTKDSRDSIAVKNDNTWDEGKDTYIRRFKENFGLADVDVWNVSDNGHRNWLNQVMR